ncbi:wax ester/triacylglycerol synthase family O-acyltransferase [Streptomyces sp. YS415]|uniref:wax ester/triacylglycerol synthase family O-acyltransferase n=1 Tax=Streptomyces sp. YS415 TaxID=2944806 RepID=UPI002020D935|nr:wax ester/triacylglycerol synthase family O-acyltransferase [Streptomyces sp. YS415]MCL7428972.1 wax ester/triacylglycerol synthase family O-acyltransferase [Streptomyces sp. YS415]
MAPHHEKLSFADEVLLRNGCPGVVGMAAVFAGDPPALSDVRDRVVERWGVLERMHQVLEHRSADAPFARRGLRGAARWTVTGPFDPDVHVLDSPAKLEDLWAASTDRPLPGGVPPWRLYLVPGVPGEGFALSLIAQHTLIDGRSLQTLLCTLMDGTASAQLSGRPTRLPRVGLRDVRGEIRALTAPGQALPMDEPTEACPSVAVLPLPPHLVSAARRPRADGRRASLNELLLSAVAGALRTTFGPPEQWPGKVGAVYSAVPCDLRTQENLSELGNIVTAVRVRVPVDTDSPEARLRQSQLMLQGVPARAAAHALMFSLTSAVRRMCPWATRLATGRGYRPSYMATSTTVLRWHDAPSAFYGRDFRQGIALPPMHRPGNASFAAVKTRDALAMTVVCNMRPDEAQLLGEAVIAELQVLAG